ncbi:MAG TPA: divergent PAP2 family protein [Candidatus Merdivicinus faecavium]|nr:divergent PAP2 family protein [Candidatus Merdivicinus faecavium]
MEFFAELAQNRVLWTAMLCWLSAQVIKVIFYAVRNRHFSFERLVGAGGMPSSHSATVCGLAVAVGRTCGLASPMFAIAMIVAAVVMYDATGVRRAAGEQAKVLNRLILEQDWSQAQKNLKEFLGHTPLEVLAGAILGIALAFLVPIA